MSLQGAVAALLLRGSAHGYELHSVLELELGPLWTTKASQLYLTLGRMQRDDVVTVKRISQANRPDRQLLALTPGGQRLAEEWLMRGDRPAEHVARLAVARIAAPHRFEEVADAIVLEQNDLLRKLRSMRATAEGGFQAEALEAEIMVAQAALRWAVAQRENAADLLSRPPASSRDRGRGDANAQRGA